MEWASGCQMLSVMSTHVRVLLPTVPWNMGIWYLSRAVILQWFNLFVKKTSPKQNYPPKVLIILKTFHILNMKITVFSFSYSSTISINVWQKYSRVIFKGYEFPIHALLGSQFSMLFSGPLLLACVSRFLLS